MFEDRSNEPPAWATWLLYGVAVSCLFGIGWMVVEAVRHFLKGH